jgi:acetyl-CoA acetyltransferase
MGEIEVAVIAAGDIFFLGPGAGLASRVGVSYQDAFGWGGPNSRFGMIQRRYMHDRGVTLEQLGKFRLAFSKNGQRNPHAMAHDYLSMEHYLHSRMISDPVRLFDCCRPCSGGGAVIVASERKAKELMEHPVYVVSDAEKTNYAVSEPLPDQMIMGFKAIADELFSAGVSRDDVDVFELYDDYPVAMPMTLESLGFIERDKVGEFIDSHDFSFEGDFPINTSGGQLAEGQAGLAGGLVGVIEAVRQLKEEGGARQVKGAKTALVSGLGSFSYVLTLACWGAMILQRR